MLSIILTNLDKNYLKKIVGHYKRVGAARMVRTCNPQPASSGFVNLFINICKFVNQTGFESLSYFE